MKEAPVEERLRIKLTAHGFKVLKFACPGTSHVMDRFILRPKWSPGAPFLTEVKRPGEMPRRAQELTAQEWRARGVQVTDPVSSFAEVDELVEALVSRCKAEAHHTWGVL